MELTTSERIRVHLRSNVVGYIALFAVLALAPAYAAQQKAPKNSVVSKSIKDGQVKTSDIGDGQVGAVDLAAGALNWNSLQGVPAGFADGTDAGGGVSSVGSGAGLTGGPITDAGTLALAPCPNGQLLKSTGGGYACGVDVDTNSGGSVTSVGSGAGLTGGPVTDAGTLALAPCPNGQLLKSTGGGYACAADIDTDTNSGGDVTGVTAGNGLAGGGASGAVTLSVQSCPNERLLRSASPGNWACSNNYWGNSAVAADLDTTPSVAGLELLEFANTGATAITNLDDGVNGQRVTLIANPNTTISDSGVFRLSSGWAGLGGDTLTLIHNFGNWFEVARSDNN
jgi:hypothetical protein